MRENSPDPLSLQSNPSEVAANNPELFLQFETNSFELLTALGLHAHDVFEDKENVSEENLENLDKTSNSSERFKKRPQSELYDFYIRKTKLLMKLARSNAIATANVGLTTRIEHIKHATHFLSTKLK